MMERERQLNEKIKKVSDFPIQTEKTYMSQLNKMGGNIPGFQMLKERVLKPLIVATEKVVEYYLNEERVGVDPEGQIKESPTES